MNCLYVFLHTNRFNLIALLSLANAPVSFTLLYLTDSVVCGKTATTESNRLLNRLLGPVLRHVS